LGAPFRRGLIRSVTPLRRTRIKLIRAAAYFFHHQIERRSI
jgi:hypothetical protein